MGVLGTEVSNHQLLTLLGLPHQHVQTEYFARTSKPLSRQPSRSLKASSSRQSDTTARRPADPLLLDFEEEESYPLRTGDTQTASFLNDFLK